MNERSRLPDRTIPVTPFDWATLSLYSMTFSIEAATRVLKTSVGDRTGCRIRCGRRRTDDARLPWRSRGAYGGWGGHEHFGTRPGATRTPIVFVHGNDRDACDWEAHAAHFIEQGYRGDELWAISFSKATPTHAEMVDQLDAFVARVREETGSDAVSIVAHSLGVTGARYWLETEDRYDRVENVVGIAGANHGVSLCAGPEDAGVMGEYSKPCRFIGYDCPNDPTHPLAKLNAGDETPGNVTYYTIRGAYDLYYWRDPESPALDGAAENVTLPTDHDGVRTSADTKALLYEWLSAPASA